EFFATVAADNVFRAHAAPQQRANFAQHVVARLVAKSIVEKLEAVDVRHHNANADSILRLVEVVELLLQRGLQETPVVEPGERIADRLVLQLFLQLQVGQPQSRKKKIGRAHV